jgi:hypothetical protein
MKLKKNQKNSKVKKNKIYKARVIRMCYMYTYTQFPQQYWSND